MSYDELVSYLVTKYGPAKYDYFSSENCTTKNRRVTRTSNGLFCHHIDEDKADKLSDSTYAAKYPFAYQKAERLVYCNYLEHLLLHIQISKLRHEKKSIKITDVKELSKIILPGVKYICADLNYAFDYPETQINWKKKCFDVVSENYDDYISILRDFIQFIERQYVGPGKKTTKKNSFNSEIEFIRFQLSMKPSGYISDYVYADLYL